MDREILFRGKRIYNGEWVYGYVAHSKSDNSCVIMSEPHGYEDVDWNSVGQYAGLTDRKGKKIFEGDIIHILGNQDVEDWKDVDYIAQIVFIDGGFCAIDGTVENHGFRRYDLARFDFEMEVIGNVFDTPELLKGD